jgi:hypothetical protein
MDWDEKAAQAQSTLDFLESIGMSEEKLAPYRDFLSSYSPTAQEASGGGVVFTSGGTSSSRSGAAAPVPPSEGAVVSCPPHHFSIFSTCLPYWSIAAFGTYVLVMAARKQSKGEGVEEGEYRSPWGGDPLPLEEL